MPNETVLYFVNKFLWPAIIKGISLFPPESNNKLPTESTPKTHLLSIHNHNVSLRLIKRDGHVK